MKSARAPRGALAAGLLAAACSSPPAPVIPDREIIGPPNPDAVSCPPTLTFAQSPFLVADLETGAACDGFLEQDECVVALYRDCTVDASSRRAWQGRIDQDRYLVLHPTCLTGGCPESPDMCSGTLIDEEPLAPWARLACARAGGSGGEHGGFYFERNDGSVPAFGSFDPSRTISFPPGAKLHGFALISGGRFLAISGAGTGSAGVYVGMSSGGEARRATELDGEGFQAPSAISASPDQTMAFIAEGTRVVRVRAADLTTTPLTLASEVTAMTALPSGLLVAQGSRLMLLDYTDLSTSATIDLGARVGVLAPMAGADPRRMAVAGLDTRELRVLTSSLSVSATSMLSARPDHLAGLTTNTIAVAAGQRFVVVDLVEGRKRPPMVVPGATAIGALLYDPLSGKVLAGGERGAVAVLDPLGERPMLSAAVAPMSDQRVTALASEPSSGTFLALLPDENHILVIQPAAR